MEKTLIENRHLSYGTNSRTIYLDFCDKYGWKKELSNNFGYQGALLYAENATQEGYSVWMLSNSDLIKHDKNAKSFHDELNKNSKITRTWINVFLSDEDFKKYSNKRLYLDDLNLDTIREYHTYHNIPFTETDKKAKRLVFAKIPSSDGYVFLGVYTYKELHKLNEKIFEKEVIYKKISNVYYPINDSIIDEPQLPDWLKVGAIVKHKQLQEVEITNIDEKNITINDSKQKTYTLDLKNCLENKVFSQIIKNTSTNQNPTPITTKKRSIAAVDNRQTSSP